MLTTYVSMADDIFGKNKKFWDCYTQAFSNLLDITQSDIFLGTFNHANVSTMNASKLCQLFLGELLRLAILLNVLSEPQENRLFSHDIIGCIAFAKIQMLTKVINIL